MSFPQNLHTHTVFSDGKNTPEEMVLGALQAGCASLAFSDHSPMSPAADPDGWSMKPEKVPAYRAEIIFLGLEQDIDSPPPAEEWDCLIGSVHGVWAGGCYLPVDESADAFDRAVREYFSGDCLAFARAYYRREAEAAGKTGCDIVGHFDLITKFNENGCRFDESDPRYRSAALEALEALMEKDVIFEINTGAISRGCRTTPTPPPSFWMPSGKRADGYVSPATATARTPLSMLSPRRRLWPVPAVSGRHGYWQRTVSSRLACRPGIHRNHEYCQRGERHMRRSPL